MSRQFAVGIMTGTSLDGVDLALVALDGVGDNITCELLHFISLPLANDLKERLTAVCHDDTAKVSQICSLNCELGALYSQSVTVLLNEVETLTKQFPQRFKDFSGKLDFIASHGQTIYHLPSTIHKSANRRAQPINITDRGPIVHGAGAPNGCLF